MSPNGQTFFQSPAQSNSELLRIRNSSVRTFIHNHCFLTRLDTVCSSSSLSDTNT